MRLSLTYHINVFGIYITDFMRLRNCCLGASSLILVIPYVIRYQYSSLNKATSRNIIDICPRRDSQLSRLCKRIMQSKTAVQICIIITSHIVQELGHFYLCFLRSKGLNILSYVDFCVDFRTELLTNQPLCVRSEIHVMWTKVRSKMITQV